MINTIFTAIHHSIADCILYAVKTDDALHLIELRICENSPANQCFDKSLSAFREMIIAYLDGNVVDFSKLPLKMNHYTDFQQSVLNAAREITRGTTICYEELAYRAGYPGASRAVGSVMRKNPFPIIIPCHRVVQKSGKIGGYCGMMHGKMAELKRNLLKLEGL